MSHWESHWQCPLIGGPMDGQFIRLLPHERPIPVFNEVVEVEDGKFQVCEYILEDLTGWDDKVYWYYRHSSIPDSDKCFELLMTQYCGTDELQDGEFFIDG